MLYRFTDTPELEGLTLEVRAIHGRLSFTAHGRAAKRCIPSLHAYFAWLNAVHPVRERDGTLVYSLYVHPEPSQAHARQLENFLRNRLFGRRTPMAATLAVTDACQLACPHCSAALRAGPLPTLDTAAWQHVIGECVDVGASVVTFTGGEPLLRADLETLVAAVPRDKAVAEFFCNGLAATEERLVALRDAGVYGVHLSVDDPDPAVHDRLRGREGVFSSVASAARTASRLGLLVGISTFATDESVDHRKVSRVAALAAEWGACEVSVFDGIRTGRLLHACGPLLDAPHRRRLLTEARRANRAHRGTLRVITQSWTNSRRGFSLLIGCLAANLQCHVTPQGEFTPCDFTPLTFGNVQDASVGELWQRILDHPAYAKRSLRCRMQSPEFRAAHIDTIPEDADLPYPIGADAGRAT